MAELNLGEIIIRIIVILIAAKIGGYLAEKLKQPSVLGELIVGVIIGPSLFGLIPTEPGQVISFLSEIGIIILLFDIGLESNIHHLLKVGWSSLFVAFIGVISPFFLGYLLFTIFGAPPLESFFVGATLTATSVGVTLRVLSDIKKLNSNEGKIILGAAVIDDVLGLIILSVLGGIAVNGGISLLSILKIIFISLIYLVGTLYIGIKFAPFIFKIVHKMKIKRSFIISSFTFAIFMALIANSIGLATIVGAFAAGIILESTEHKEHIRQRLKPLVDLFVPIFFVMSGVLLELKTFSNPQAFGVVILILVVAIVGKLLSGLGAFNIKASKLSIGIGMIPRGEVGLIFASFGLTKNIIDSNLYSILVSVIILTTFVTPPLIKYVMDRGNNLKNQK